MRRRTRVAIGVTGLAATGVAVAALRPHVFRSSGCTSPVTISRDALGIPHVIADNEPDLAFGMGYAMAEDRMFQMDLLRRTAFGTLSEVAGAATLESDRKMRLFNIGQIAERMLEVCDERERSQLESFADGVNFFLKRNRTPIEFRLARSKPEPWRPADTAALIRMFGLALSDFHETDLTIERLRRELGDEWAEAIALGRTVDAPPIMREPTDISARRVARSAWELSPRDGFSNAWAVSGSKTADGFPLLANDPHLGYTNPSMWCELRLTAPGIEAAGLTLAGVPALAFGRTPSFAWGFTAAMVPQTFVYSEDDAEIVSERVETIHIKGKPTQRFRIRSTARGPLLSDALPERFSTPVSIYWTGTETGAGEISAWLALQRCRSVDDAVALRSSFIVPSLIMAAADDGGNIASIGVGRWAEAPLGLGLRNPSAFPLDYRSADQIPVEVNPDRGWIASANNRILPKPAPLLGYHEPEHRIRRIAQLLDGRNDLTAADMHAMQHDIHSLHAAAMVPHMLDLVGEYMPGWARADLEAWDFEARASSRACLLFQSFYRQWVAVALAERLSDGLADRLLDGLVVGDVPQGFCDDLLAGEHAAWWTTRSHRELAAEDAWDAAVATITNALGSEPTDWTWAGMHTVSFEHPLGIVPGPHQRAVNIGPFAIDGDSSTLAVAKAHPRKPFDVAGGPTMRLVASLSDPNNTWVTNALGQDGTPLSPHYRDQVKGFIGTKHHSIWNRRRRVRVRLLP